MRRLPGSQMLDLPVSTPPRCSLPWQPSCRAPASLPRRWHPASGTPSRAVNSKRSETQRKQWFRCKRAGKGIVSSLLEELLPWCCRCKKRSQQKVCRWIDLDCCVDKCGSPTAWCLSMHSGKAVVDSGYHFGNRRFNQWYQRSQISCAVRR